MMHQSVLKVPKGLQALFLASGYDAAYVKHLTDMALDEIESCRVMNWMKVSTLDFLFYGESWGNPGSSSERCLTTGRRI